MKKLQLSLCALAAYVLLVAGFGIAGSRPATGQAAGKGLPPGPDVRVVNTDSNPVPITGQVAVASLPAIQIDTTNPIPVTNADSPAMQPFNVGFDEVLAGFVPRTFTIPAGKRLVIANLQARAASGNAHALTIVSTVNGKFSVIEAPFSIIRNSDIWVNQQVLGFADPGSTVEVYYTSMAADSAVVSINGYFVDVP